VLGVLIALAAEQTVEALNWVQKVQSAQAAMRLELLTDDGVQAEERLAIAKCNQDRLSDLARQVIAARDSGGRLQIERPYTAQFRTWDMESWQAAVSSGAIQHLSADKAMVWQTFYSMMPTLSLAAAKEYEDVADVRTLAYPRGHLSEAEADRLLVAIERLRRDDDTIVTAANYLLRAMSQAGLKTDPKASANVVDKIRKAEGACVVDPSRFQFPDYGKDDVARPEAAAPETSAGPATSAAPPR
jgi:hypothetical protein